MRLRRRHDDHGALQLDERGIPRKRALRRARRLWRLAHQRRHDRGPRDLPAPLADVLRSHDGDWRHVHGKHHQPRGATAVRRRFVDKEAGQGTVEFALVLAPILILLVFGLVELANLLSSAMTMSSATREGARLGGALVNGGGTLGCSAGQSPNAATVDAKIVAAVERVLTGNGTRIKLSDVSQIRIWKATATGAETSGLVNVWNYQLNGGPTVDGQPLDFVQQSQPWQPCARNNVTPVDSIGVTVVYTYRAQTPLRFFMPYFNTIGIADHTVMALHVSR